MGSKHEAWQGRLPCKSSTLANTDSLQFICMASQHKRNWFCSSPSLEQLLGRFPHRCLYLIWIGTSCCLISPAMIYTRPKELMYWCTLSKGIGSLDCRRNGSDLCVFATSFRDDIKSLGKFAIRSPFKIARNKTGFHYVSAILNSHRHWTPSLPPILNELRIANFPELLMSSLTCTP